MKTLFEKFELDYSKYNPIHEAYNGEINLNKSSLSDLLEFSKCKINKVMGDFDCGNNTLVSLEGCPKIICGSFNCMRNELTSLKFGPEIVGGNYHCNNNKLWLIK